MKRPIILIPIVLVLLIGISTTNAQRNNDPSAPYSSASTAPSTGYDLTWNTIDGGGDASTGSGFTLMGTIGQPDSGLLMSGGGYSLAGGFWGSWASEYQVYLPVVIK